MRIRRQSILLFSVVLLAVAGAAYSQQVQMPRPARAVGTIKDVQAGSLTLTPDSGHDITVVVAPSTKLLRVEPGQTDLKNATPLAFTDLHVGDRVLVRGQGPADGQSITAVSVIAMKHADVLAKQEHDRQDWQRRGVGGLVTAVDDGGKTISINAGGLGNSRIVAVHAGSNTIVRSYAPDSVKFEDAQPSSLVQIKPGDQLRARGALDGEGKELAAEEIVFGSFRNIAGTITTIDAANNSLTVQDAIAKSAVIVKVLPDSQMKKLPAEMAQRIAMRLKANREGVGQRESANTALPPGNGNAGAMPARMPGVAAGRTNGSPDFERFLNRIPTVSLPELQKGDAVMIVATSGDGSHALSAITLLAGVEPLLTAAPNHAASLVLSPWTLGNSNAEAEAAP